jgi:hypothetical protein
LDYFHASEHLYKFSERLPWERPQKRKRWCEKQKVLLFESQTQPVIENIQSTLGKEKAKKELINYYQDNIDRMDYKR